MDLYISCKEIKYKIAFSKEALDKFPSIRKVAKGNLRDVEGKLNGLYVLLQDVQFTSFSEICCGVGFSSLFIKTK